MTRNIGLMGDAKNYKQFYIGTYHLIEDYNNEIVKSLNWIEGAMPKLTQLDSIKKLEFFIDLKHALGNTALILSGGANLGAYHIGVCQALYYSGLLPRIISGSSAGALIAAFVCTRTDFELEEVLSLKSVNLNFLKETSHLDNYSNMWLISMYKKILRIITTGASIDFI